MEFLSDDDRERVRQATREAEAKTRGEIVTVVARAADAYLYIPLLWASLVALLIPGVILLLPWDPHGQTVYTIQVLVFAALALGFRWTPLKMRLIPARVKRLRAHRVAMEQFFEQNLHHTVKRTGVLLFVSVAERYVEVIADQGIHEQVPEGAWDEVIAEFVDHVRRGEVADGFVTAIGHCGGLLAEHFPARKRNPNELPDRLVEL